jgi:hypothetical protein
MNEKNAAAILLLSGPEALYFQRYTKQVSKCTFDRGLAAGCKQL